MAEKNTFDLLKRLFSTDVIIRNVGGDQLKVVDTGHIQSSGKYQTNSLVDRFTRLYIYNNKNIFNPNLNYQSLRTQLYSDYEAMDTDPIIASVLDIIADEACVRSEFNEILSIKSSDENIQRVLYNLFYDILNIEFNLWTWTRGMVKYGDYFLKLEISDKFGVYNVIPYTVYHMSRHEGLDPENPTKVTFKLNPDGIAASQDVNFKPRTSGTSVELDNYEVAHFRLLSDTNFLPYGRCLPKDSYVELENGVKQIHEINKGDRVWTFNTVTGRYELASVLATCESGKKDILRINTRHNTLRCSENHPILVFDPKNREYTYKRAEDIKLGDLLCVSKKDFIGEDVLNPKLDKTLEGFNKNGWKNKIDCVPDRVTPEFARFFGFMLGDGYIVSNTQVNFAQGIRKERNEYYQALLRKFSGKEKLNFINNLINGTDQYANCSVGSKMLATVLRNNGFHGKCYTKRFPKWIYSCDKYTQMEFLRGLVDADGSISTDKWGVNRYQLMMCNENILKDAKTLLNRLGVKTGKILRNPEKEFCYFGDKQYNANQGYYFYFYLEGKKKTQFKKYLEYNQNPEIILDPVLSLELESKQEDTFDIQVDSKNSNFIANGIIVHNSYIEPARKVYKQLCLAGDSKIWTPTGYQFIKDINPGDVVYSFNLDKNTFEETKVKHQAQTGVEPTYTVYTKNQVLRGTGNHPVLLSNGKYIQIQELQRGDIIRTGNRVGSEVEVSQETVLKVEYNEEPQPVYDIEVESEQHNFISDGVTVHNCLLEDAMMLHRIMRSPEKRVFYINVGSIPPNEVEQFMQKTINSMKKTPYVNNDGQYNMKFNMQNMMEDFYIPVRGNDQTTKIDTSKGLEYDGTNDIEYLRDKLFAALKVPKAFLGFEGELSGKATLSSETVRFAKTVERIQRILESELTKIALVHLAAQGFEGESLTNFDLKLTTPSIIFEQEKIALLKEKVDLASQMLETNLFPTDYVFEKIFDLSEDTYMELKDLVIEDKKQLFRLSQIENEGNDPAKTGRSYGTPHDLASMYGRRTDASERGGGVGEVPPGYEELPNPPMTGVDVKDVKIGRPRIHKSLYGTNNYPNGGRDPLGVHGMKGGYPSDNENVNEGVREVSKTQTLFYRHSKDLSCLTEKMRNKKEPEMLNEENLLDLDN